MTLIQSDLNLSLQPVCINHFDLQSLGSKANFISNHKSSGFAIQKLCWTAGEDKLQVHINTCKKCSTMSVIVSGCFWSPVLPMRTTSSYQLILTSNRSGETESNLTCNHTKSLGGKRMRLLWLGIILLAKLPDLESCNWLNFDLRIFFT